VAARRRLNVLVVFNGSRPDPAARHLDRENGPGRRQRRRGRPTIGLRSTSAADTIAASHRMRRKLAVTQGAAGDLPTSSNVTFRPPPSGTVQQRLCGESVGRLGPEYYNSLILMASPRGFEPLLPP
jgi:hypothetical protein